MKRFFFDCGTRDAVASAGLLVLRVGIGLMMLLGHGWGKLSSFQDKKDAFPVPEVWPLSLMSPPVSMIMTIFAEVGCAALIVLGLATRPAAFVLGFAMTVAAFVVHGAGPWFLGSGEGPKEPALLYLIPCLVLIIAGAGRASVDSLIYKEKKKRFF